MDGETFDDLVKRLTQTRLSRVAAVRGVLASAVVGLTGATRAEETAARKRAKGKGKKARRKRGRGSATSRPRRSPRSRSAITGRPSRSRSRRCRGTSSTATPWARVALPPPVPARVLPRPLLLWVRWWRLVLLRKRPLAAATASRKSSVASPTSSAATAPSARNVATPTRHAASGNVATPDRHVILNSGASTTTNRCAGGGHPRGRRCDAPLTPPRSAAAAHPAAQPQAA